MSNRAFAHVAHGDYQEAYEVLTTGRDLAKERENPFVVGRMTNTLGWLYQEFGDFTRAQELDRESEALAKRIKNGNVETSALINQGFDSLHLGDPARALRLFEETLVRAEKAFGAHRWRWSMHLRFGLALALRALDRDGEAAVQAARGLRQTATAVTELGHALDIARRIGFPTLTWQSAHLLAQAHAADRPDEALSAATRAAETIERMEASAPDAQLRQTLRAWPRVRAVYETLERLRRG